MCCKDALQKESLKVLLFSHAPSRTLTSSQHAQDLSSRRGVSITSFTLTRRAAHDRRVRPHLHIPLWVLEPLHHRPDNLFEIQSFNLQAGARIQRHPEQPTLFRLLGCFSPSKTARSAASSFSLSKATASGSSSSHFICSSTGAKVASANEDLPVPPTWRVSVRCIRIWSMSSSPKLAAAWSAASSWGSKSLLHERMSGFSALARKLLGLVRCLIILSQYSFSQSWRQCAQRPHPGPDKGLFHNHRRLVSIRAGLGALHEALVDVLLATSDGSLLHG